MTRPAPIAWTSSLGMEGMDSPIYQMGRLRVIESDDQEFGDGEKWKHVSFSTRTRLPDWNEMKLVRETFFPPDAEVLQIFPPQAEWVNTHPFTLHFWWCKTRRLTPDFRWAVGLPGVEWRAR
jgi:hypothetical protein